MIKAKSKNVSNHPVKRPSRWHAVPLKSSFMASAMLGFFISMYYVYPQSVNYGIAFMIIFGAMVIAAIISMTKAPIVRSKQLR